MSNLLAPSLLEAPEAPAAPPAMAPPPAPRWRFWREPLLHFIVIGGLLFAVDAFIQSRTGDRNTIVVGADVDSEAIETFEAARGRKPDAKELEALHRVWLDNEILYREGLAMQVDKGDTAIRERVIFKMLSVVDSGVKVPEASEAVLRPWFEQHRAKYDQPARYDFDEAALTGQQDEAAVRAFVDQLNQGAPGDAKAGLRVFKGRPHSNLVESYGEVFAVALAAAPIGTWVPLQTKDGWRAVRVNVVTPAQSASFEVVRLAVLQDWKDALASEQRTQAVRALGQKYRVVYEERNAGSPE